MVSLSICTVTAAPPERLERWLLRALEVADELVVTVDAAAGPATVAVALELADRVTIAELDGIANPAYGWTAGQATGDWVLMLDDDEILAPGFAERARNLMADRRYSHYHLPVRWVARGPDGEPAWIRQFPWWPNRATRMFRNIGGLAWHGPEAHSAWRVHGEGRAPKGFDAAIYHLDLLVNDRAAREAKVENYRACGPGTPSCEEYYLYEDYLETIAFMPLPEQLLDATPSPAAAQRARERRARPGTRREPRRLSMAELRRHVSEGADRPPIWSAEYLAHATPGRLAANRGYAVPVTVKNTSSVAWRSLGQVDGRVLLSYRWFAPDGSIVIPQGDVSLLPQALPAGQWTTVDAGLWTPAEPGPHRLEWDMLCERVGWFSENGVTPLSVSVEITDVGRRPRAPHFPSAPSASAHP